MPKGIQSTARLAGHVSHIALWWAALPPENRKPYYTPRQLEDALQAPMRATADALRLSGWSKCVMRHKARVVAYWKPPAPWGSFPPRRPRGRPIIDLMMLLGGAQWI